MDALQTRQIRRYGWRPSLPGSFDGIADTAGLRVETEVDLRTALPPVFDQGQLGSCFPAGTLVRMADGSERAIENVRLAEHVVTAEGRTGMVRQTMVRMHADGLVKLSLWGYGGLRMTGEHPVLTRRGYVRAAELFASDVVGLPRYTAPETTTIYVAEFLTKQERMLKAGVRKMGALPGRADVAVRVASLPDTIDLTERFGRLAGLFLAEGSTDSGKVCWTFGAHERDTLVPETVDLLRDLGVDGYVQERPNNSINVVCYGTAWSRLWERLCGTGAGEKVIHPVIAGGPETFRRAVLGGWLAGDGYMGRKIGRHQRVVGTTVSKALAVGLYDIAQSLGLKPLLRREKAKTNDAANKRRDFYSVDVSERAGHGGRQAEQDDTYVWRKVRALEQEEFAGLVYNLSVEGDESYVAEGIGVHNCTANATACAFQWDAILDGKLDGPLSRLWIYYGERKIEGTLGQGDTGAEGHDAYTVASTLGIPPESAWPYDISTFQGPIPALATKDETYYKLTKPVHAVPQTETAIKQVLSNRQIVTFGFTVYESFESQAVAETGIVPMPAKGEKILGGHEIAVVGYLAAHPQHALVRNSWGVGWGLKGYALFPWAYLASRSLSSDLRTIVRPAGK